MKIIHIGQVHLVKSFEEESSEYATRDAVASQINIALYVLKLLEKSLGNAPLIMNGGRTSLFNGRSECGKIDFCHDIRENFSKELFFNYSSSNDYTGIQKKLLHDKGAGVILQCIGAIEVLYPAKSMETPKKTNIDDALKDFYTSEITVMVVLGISEVLSTISTKFGDYIYDNAGIGSYLQQKFKDFIKDDDLGIFLPREIAALKIARDLTKEMNTDTAVIIYGKGHDFTEACNKVGCESLTSVSFEESKGLMDSIWYYLGYGKSYTTVEKEMVLDTNDPIDNQNSYDQTGLGHGDL